MKAVALFFLVLAIPAVGFAQNVNDAKVDKGNNDAKVDDGDAKRIEGRWKVESSQDGGKSDSSAKRLVLLLKDDKLTAMVGDDVQGKGTYKLDPSKTPKWIDLSLGDITFLGIYDLKGDTLMMCHGRPGDPRSTQLVSEAGSSNRVLTVLRRATEESN